jgi:four helix bundle protein
VKSGACASFVAVPFDYRDLFAYSASAELGDELHDRIVMWPSFERWTLGVQLLRAADSIAANVAEAAGRWQPDDKKRFFVIARGSMYETDHWLRRAAARDLLPNSYSARVEEIGKALSGLINAQRRRPNP